MRGVEVPKLLSWGYREVFFREEDPEWAGKILQCMELLHEVKLVRKV
jgi:hypothetical protein